jgi:ribonuclease HI
MQSFLTSILRGMIKVFRNSSELEVYTDGSSKGGVGSWAYVISRNGKCIAENSGRVRRANSNSMEFQAAIEALRSVPEDSNVTVFSDSRILVDAMSQGAPLRALQTQLDALSQLNGRHTIQWQWVKAHNGNKFNERCDELCIWARTNTVSKSVPFTSSSKTE